MKNKRILLLFFITIVLSIFTRFHNLENFYSETDDQLSIEQLVRYDKLELYDIANDKSSPSYNSPIKTYLRELQLKKNGLVDNIQKKISTIIFNLAPSKHSTFAPLQYLMFGWMLNTNQDYNDLKFYSRVPSAIFSILTIFITYLLCKKIFRKENYFIFLPCVLVMCSYPMIFISQRSYNYSAAVFGVTLLFYLFFKEIVNLNDSRLFINKSKIKIKRNFYFSLILAMTSYLSYVCLLIMPVFFIFKFTKEFIKKQKILTISNYNLVICGLFYSAIIFPLLYYMLTLELYNYGMTASTAGNNFEYSIITNENNYIRFFSYNFYLIIVKNLSFFLDDFIGANILQGFIFFITIIGALFVFKKNIKNRYEVLIYLFISILLYWIILVFLNITAFGPTRHLLIFTPVISIIFTYGLKVVNRKTFIKEKNLSIVAITTIIVIFLLNYSNFLYYYKDSYDEKNLNSLIKKYNIKYIVNDISQAHLLCLMPSIEIKINSCRIRYNRYEGNIILSEDIYKEVKSKAGSIAFISYSITDKIKLDLINNDFHKTFEIKNVKFINKSPLFISKYVPNYIELIIYD